MASSKKTLYGESDLIGLFGLTRTILTQTPEMTQWLDVQPPVLDMVEQGNFDRILSYVVREMPTEEEFRMHVIGHILPLGHLIGNLHFKGFCERKMTGIVDGIKLDTTTHFMAATGILNLPQKSYFHLQQYQSSKNLKFDSMAQLLEAMLITQEKNNNGKPVYGCEILRKSWTFVTLKGREYCIAGHFCTEKEEHLRSIIAILRHFKHILETELLDDI